MTDVSVSSSTFLLGAVAALVVAAAQRARSLSPSGAVAAVAMGGLSLAAGAGWAALLLVYFVSSTALSRLGRAAKAARTASVIAKGGSRDAWQVAANGGVFALAAIGTLSLPDARWGAAAAGALAASAADTWATEIGTWIGGTPRHLLTGRQLAPGLSGGVSVAGTLAMLAGAVGLGIFAEGVGVVSAWAPVAAGGVVGAMTDSLAGATLQSRRVCEGCGAVTEQVVHTCGGATRRTGGVEGIGNDAVNALATLTGALVAVGAVWSAA